MQVTYYEFEYLTESKFKYLWDNNDVEALEFLLSMNEFEIN